MARVLVRRDAGLYGYERALGRAGFSPVAGADEAGRGACAGPLVAAAVVLPAGPRGVITGLRDSKLMTAASRERAYDQIRERALSWAVVEVSAGECDRLGMHVANVSALRRAVGRLSVAPEFVLTDGFPVDGVGTRSLAVWKGDRVSASVAAASVLAKVTRDRIMVALDEEFGDYEFAVHKGYCTPLHQRHLDELGPCPQHRMRYANVARTVRADGGLQWAHDER